MTRRKRHQEQPHVTKPNDPLASLRGDASASAPTTLEPSGDFVLLDYHGKTGSDRRFDHHGDLVLLTRDPPFRLRPGLNLVRREQWAAYEADPKIQAERATGSIKPVSSDLREYAGRVALLDLVKRTLSADALDYLLERERTKPHNGPGKQDPRILELLTSRAKAAASQREPDLSGVLSMAQQQADALTIKHKDKLAKAG